MSLEPGPCLLPFPEGPSPWQAPGPAGLCSLKLITTTLRQIWNKCVCVGWYYSLYQFCQQPGSTGHQTISLLSLLFYGHHFNCSYAEAFSQAVGLPINVACRAQRKVAFLHGCSCLSLTLSENTMEQSTQAKHLNFLTLFPWGWTVWAMTSGIYHQDVAAPSEWTSSLAATVNLSS